MELKFRPLEADEVECRVNQINEKGLTLLLFKNSRTDMDLLDEVVGPLNWKREHTRDNANCIVSIYDTDTKEWVSKEDTGTESNTEKEKGLASDSFKRACVNWGIGRELYTPIFIYIKPLDDKEFVTNDKGKYSTFTKFRVNKITCDAKKNIIGLEIIDNKKNIRFQFGKI